MPKRQNTRRVDSAEVQGEGSFVVVKAINYGAARKAREESGGDTDDSSRERIGAKMISDNVVEWNWVDDNGEPLPQLNGSLETLDLLTANEVEFLTKAITGDPK